MAGKNQRNGVGLGLKPETQSCQSSCVDWCNGSPILARSSSPKKPAKKPIRDLSGNVVARINTFSNEGLLNYSLPSLAKKNGQFSQVAEFRPEYRSSKSKPESMNSRFKVIGPTYTEDQRLETPDKLNPQKRLPVLSTGKKKISVISKSSSASEFEPLGGNPNQDTREHSETPQWVPNRGNTGETTDTSSLQNITFKEYYFQTMPGFSDGRTKTNQDEYYINFTLRGSNQSSLFAVFDGHGPQGHRVSDFLKRSLTSRFTSLGSIEQRFDPAHDYGIDEYTGILEGVCLDINSKLTANRLINSFFSGSTGVIVLMHRDVVSCANVGDSRAALFRKADSGEISIYKLSNDHTPADPKEKERVVRAGGKVHPCIGSLYSIRFPG